MTATPPIPCTPGQARQFAGCVTLLTAARGMTRETIADAIHVAPITLDAYLDGAERPDVAQLATLWKIALEP